MPDACINARARLQRSISVLLSGEVLTGQKQIVWQDKRALEHVGTCQELPCSAIRAALLHAVQSPIKEQP